MEKGHKCLCGVPWLLVGKSRAVGHVSTRTKDMKSLYVQVGAFSRSVLSLNFSLTEQTFGAGQGKERLKVKSVLCSPFKLFMSKILVAVQGLLHL